MKNAKRFLPFILVIISSCGVSISDGLQNNSNRGDQVVLAYRRSSNDQVVTQKNDGLLHKGQKTTTATVDTSSMKNEDKWNYRTQKAIESICHDLLPDNYFFIKFEIPAATAKEKRILDGKGITPYYFSGSMPLGDTFDYPWGKKFFLKNKFISGSHLSALEVKRLVGLTQFLYTTNGLLFEKGGTLQARYIKNSGPDEAFNNFRDAVRILINYQHKLIMKYFVLNKWAIPEELSSMKLVGDTKDLETILLIREKASNNFLHQYFPMTDESEALAE